MSQVQRDKYQIVLVVAGLYLFAIFPFAYFRHDDWLILGNSAYWLPKDWNFLLRPTLFFRDIEEVWFFRPFFKLGVYLFYQSFGFSYTLWLIVLFCCVVAAFHFLRLSAELLGGRSQAYCIFIFLWSSLYVHFGSVAWMGEGMMNCPQLLLLSLSLYLFLRAKNGGAILCYLLALGFKESGVIHAALVCALVIEHPYFNSFSKKQKLKKCLPWMLSTATFLLVRLKFMPINPAYRPGFEWEAVLRPVLIFAAAFTLPLILSFLVRARIEFWRILGEQLRTQGLFVALIFLSLLPFLGHNFFSPGWLLLPTCYWILFLSRPIGEALTFSEQLKSARILLAVSVCVVGGWLYAGGWWQWQGPQRQLHAEISHADPEKVDQIVLIECKNEKFSKATLHRVIGFENGIKQLWRMTHTNSIRVSVRPCDYMPTNESLEHVMVLKWKFPNLTRLGES